MGEEEVRTLPTPLGLTDFDLGVTLGTGSFGRVRFVTHKVSKRCMVDPVHTGIAGSVPVPRH